MESNGREPHRCAPALAQEFPAALRSEYNKARPTKAQVADEVRRAKEKRGRVARPRYTKSLDEPQAAP